MTERPSSPPDLFYVNLSLPEGGIYKHARSLTDSTQPNMLVSRLLARRPKIKWLRDIIRSSKLIIKGFVAAPVTVQTKLLVISVIYLFCEIIFLAQNERKAKLN